MNSKNLRSGHIKLYASILKSPIWSKPDYYLKIWLYILCKTNFRTKKTPDFTYHAGHAYIPGGYKTLARIGSNFGSKNKLSHDQVKRCVTWLKAASMLTIKCALNSALEDTTFRRGSLMVIEVINYKEYQTKSKKSVQKKKLNSALKSSLINSNFQLHRKEASRDLKSPAALSGKIKETGATGIAEKTKTQTFHALLLTENLHEFTFEIDKLIFSVTPDVVESWRTLVVEHKDQLTAKNYKWIYNRLTDVLQKPK